MIANPRLSTQFHNAAKTAIRHENLKAVGWSGKSGLVEPLMDAPLHWRKPQRIGVCFLGDLFAEAVPDAWIDRVFAVMALCPQHTFYLLSKRAERMRAYLCAASERVDEAEDALVGRLANDRDWRAIGGRYDHIVDDGYEPAAERWERKPEWVWPLPNVRLGVSVCNQAEADERIPLLLQTPAAFRWVSIEPMISEIDLRQAVPCGDCGDTESEGCRGGKRCIDSEWIRNAGLNWVVVGCESGTSRRPMPWSWAERVVEQCRAANVPCWVKQLDDANGKLGHCVIYPGDPTWPAWAKQEQPERTI